MRSIRRSAAGAALCLTWLAATLTAISAPAQATTVTPIPIMGDNPTCVDLGYDYGYKPSNGGEDVPGTFDVAGATTITWGYVKGTKSTVWWNSTDIGPDGVIVKGGNGANLYQYDGTVLADSGLVPPDNASGAPAGLSHLEFCFNYKPIVTKTATTSYTRTYEWDVAKSADKTELLLSEGQTATVNYSVVYTKSIRSESDFTVSGTVTVTNPWPAAASVVSVTDSLVTGPLTCSAATIPARGQITCDYTATVPTKAGGTNTATATVDYGSGPRTASGSAPYAFGEPTTVVNDTAVLDDTFTCPAGFTCRAPGAPDNVTVTASGSTTYSIDITADQCGMTGNLVNTATIAFGDESDSSTVTIPVESAACGIGCTLTQGYWKTHSEKGPAPYDDTWAMLPNGADTMFFGSGQTWHQVFWTAPRGNVYYLLADQYMAAKLNVLNGAAVTPEVQAAITQAEAFFSQEGMTPKAALKLSKAQRADLLMLATLLDNYNNGLIGPGHCSE